jgi:hypothetical protein
MKYALLFFSVISIVLAVINKEWSALVAGFIVLVLTIREFVLDKSEG